MTRPKRKGSSEPAKNSDEKQVIRKMILEILRDEFKDIITTVICDVLKEQFRLTQLGNSWDKLEPTVKKVEKQENDLKSVSQSLRRNNLIIKGLEQATNENQETLENSVIAVFEKVGVKRPEISSVRRLGSEGSVKRPVLVKLIRENDTKTILANKKQLGNEKIFIQKDLTLDERLAEWRLRKYFHDLKAEDLTLRASISSQSLIVWKNGKRLNSYRYDPEKQDILKMEMVT